MNAFVNDVHVYIAGHWTRACSEINDRTEVATSYNVIYTIKICYIIGHSLRPSMCQKYGSRYGTPEIQE